MQLMHTEPHTADGVDYEIRVFQTAEGYELKVSRGPDLIGPGVKVSYEDASDFAVTRWQHVLPYLIKFVKEQIDAGYLYPR